MGDTHERKITILAVLSAAEDRNSLKTILKSTMVKIRFAQLSSARRGARDLRGIAAVLTDAHLPEGRSWKDILSELEGTNNPPPLIVTDRLADEALWAEVLNLGGYDVLAKPFEEKEVLHTIELACGFRRKGPASFRGAVSQHVRWSMA